ncbi:D-alanyl-D-alanine carboxypeptidase/D-alanyl-D-alanine-endopeptidase [Algoriphagus halophilus]|uniref:D-alanyl-D-alanine carboxypeptidase / D-alanyl-D-alanine-endopeptidase (Penicillin-binding protein 4) n=1 Tax=Algoriphagus halophilus TaxID=226505 RepID=A0A1N6DKI3_9BACT|nr:D-alanyl-D-alanine carboxypeptidase [Algoriphagus halophilus]SIN71292.1 D-alanyl-D-alanine carboxypeptidase / D-alanyl-D-alanine-endopeptidase (penicillin-binding protein 4) [Algoriphagus halophilus]
MTKLLSIKNLSLVLSFFCFGFHSAYAQLNRDQYLKLEEAVGDQSFFANHLSGFELYDLDSQIVLYERNSEQRFIPASTTKLLTLFSSLIILNDSTQTFRYTTSNDTIRIWGSGDPSWNYKELYQPDIRSFIAPFNTVLFSDSNQDSPAFGYGWQWDDYYYDYSAERSPFPIYGNLVQVKKSGNRPIVTPKRFQSAVYTTNKTTRELERDFHSNNFFYNPNNFRGSEEFIPFISSPELFVELASEATGKTWVYQPDSLPKDHSEWRAAPLFPILEEMMLESDNFLAEQLMWMVSDRLFQRLDTERAIEYILKTYLNDLPDEPQWVDGSGLSRHNLVTPRSMVALFEKIYRMVPDEQLFDLLPTGGVSGTIKTSYQAQTPYIFAKTGTMSNHHSLVGLIKAKSGKMYCFAFMNSNYPYKASVVRREMEKVMVMVRDML